MLEYYIGYLKKNSNIQFLEKYLNSPSLLRLKNISYFCGMDFASKDIYDFLEIVTRYDHSLTTALLVYYLTKDKPSTIAGLVHDIATPCFSHVIDYMNKDYENQESTEAYTEDILRNDNYLNECLRLDNIKLEDIVDFKKYSIVDNHRPKLCADRLDGVILTGISWTKNITENDIKAIIDDICLFENETKELEIGFRSFDVAKKVLEISESIDIYCHSNEDNYMMELLAKITKYAIDNGYITYEKLYKFDEKELFSLLVNIDDEILRMLLIEFQTIKKKDIPQINLEGVKVRDLNPLVNGERLVRKK